MKIVFERTGGLAGRKVEAALDGADLPPAEARRLKRLLRDSAFFSLPPAAGTGPRAPDGFFFRVTVDTGERTHTVEAAEEMVEPSLRPLLDFLLRLTRR
ncbi:MAG: hypothetical protein JXP48_10105 [Acidobacteria bacterium]|nr:hypothetical protein [Acidobacteriota bacterium]